MTNVKSNLFLKAGLFFLLSVVVTGCSPVDYFNNTFLNEFQPLGYTSLNTIEGRGPLNIVVENLTEEARHQESAVFTINYIDQQGNYQTLTTPPLNAVPLDQRDPNSPDFDPSYRSIIVLDCGIREMWFSGTVYRTKIVEKEETIDLGNDKSQDISFVSASVVKFTDPNSEIELSTSEFSSIDAPQMPPFHLQQTKHFKCGDIIVVGLLDQRTGNQRIDLQTYSDGVNYVDLNSIPYVISEGDPNLFPPGTNPRFVFNPTHSLIMQEYVYPKGYVILPLTIPNMTGIDQAYSVLLQMAAELANQKTTTTTKR